MRFSTDGVHIFADTAYYLLHTHSMKEKIYLGLFIALIIFAAILYFLPARVEPPPPEPRILSFGVEPDRVENNTHFYKSGAEFIVRAEYADRVEVWFMPIAPEIVPSTQLFSGSIQSGEIRFKIDRKNLLGDVWVKVFNNAGASISSEYMNLWYDNADNQAFADEIQVELPKADDVISSPLAVKGKVRGFWFFEASMPVSVLDADKKVLAKVPVQAKGEWMTEDFVEFEGQIPFTKSTTPTGFVLFENDNPSGLPENAKSFEVPIRFR